MVERSRLVAAFAALGNGLQGWDNAAIAGEFLGGWSPNILALTVGRALTGVGVGLVSTAAPLYISECSPASIRGQLSTLPQLMGIGAMIVSYGVAFLLSLSAEPHWRLMLRFGCIPSSFYVLLTIWFLPESPAWLVTKGRVQDARIVLEYLRCSTDVSGELALLVEGLGGPQIVSVQECVVKPVVEEECSGDVNQRSSTEIVLVAPEEGVNLICEPVEVPGSLVPGLSLSVRSPSMRPSLCETVTMMEEVQQFQASGNFRTSDIDGASDFGSCTATGKDLDIYDPEVPVFGDIEDVDLAQPLLPTPDLQDKNHVDSSSISQQNSGSSFCSASLFIPTCSSVQPTPPTEPSGTSWHMTWQIENGPSDSDYSLRRVVMIPQLDTMCSSINAPSKACDQECFQALILACGVNAVMYYTPTILMGCGASFLTQFGLSNESSSIFASMMATLFMFPFILLAMHLMDACGRRSLLLSSLPLMVGSMALLYSGMTFLPPGLLLSAVSLTGLVIFSCSFVTGLGPIPNILCSEIFPTRARGVCIGICAATMWTVNIIISQAFPLLCNVFGLGGVFGLFSIMSLLSWGFVYLNVPETKGLPLEVICDIFATSAATGKPGDEAHYTG